MRGVKCVRGYIPVKECERCALNPLHPCTFTADLIAGMRWQAEHDEDGEEVVFSPSRLLSCDRRAGLEVGVGEEASSWLDTSASYPLFRGNMVHALMERVKHVPGTDSLIREVRFSVEVETRYGLKVFSGKSDLVTVKERVLLHKPGMRFPQELLICKVTDYKSKKKIEHSLTKPSREHVMQVNMYRWLVEQALPEWLVLKEGYFEGPAPLVLVDELEIAYVDMDRTRRFTSAGELQDKGKRLNRTQPYQYETLTLAPIPKIDREQIAAWVVKHIESRVKAKTEELPPPLEGEAAWVCNYCPLFDICHDLAERGV